MSHLSKKEMFVGIDVSKEILEVAMGSQGKVFQVGQRPQEWKRLASKVKAVTLVVMEATGGCVDGVGRNIVADEIGRVGELAVGAHGHRVGAGSGGKWRAGDGC